MSNIETIYLSKDQIDWHFVNIREKHGEESLELWQSLKNHGQLQPGAGWWLPNGKFRILYGHRRAVVLTTHGEKFMAMVVPREDEIHSIEKQLIENEQRLRLKPGEEEIAVKSLRDYYGNEDIVAERIGRSKAWIHLKIRASQNRESISQVIREETGSKLGLTKDELYAVPTSIIDKTMDAGLRARDRAEILDIAAREKGGISSKNIDIAIHKKKIEDAGTNELKIELANKEAEKTILIIEMKKLEDKIKDLSTDIEKLKLRIEH